MPITNKTCWIITEGIKGTENQCLGVADALGLDPVVYQIKLKQPWKSFSPFLGFEFGGIFSPALHPPWPDLLITSGRKSIAAARYIKKQSKGKTFSVHLQDPRISSAAFDLVSVPMHDPARGDNVITTLGAPNRITEEKLEAACRDFPELQKIKQPRIAVLIGGNSKAHTLSAETMHSLCRRLKALDAGLMITASRRTGEENMAILHEAFKDTDAFIWDGQGPNPYFAMLCWADYIMVTEDSVSMTSDAATTGKPVYVIPLDGGGRRINLFHRNMAEAGITRIFFETLEHWHYEPLHDAQKIADTIKNALGED